MAPPVGEMDANSWYSFARRKAKENPESAYGRLVALPFVDEANMIVNRSTLMPADESSSMELQFIGTASCIPGITRGVSCTAIRRNGAFMVFDAGEGTQKLMQESSVTVTKIQRIFVTHVHGDHTFGLAGLLCLTGQEVDRSGPPVDVYGPVGLRGYLRASLQLTASRIAAPYRVHELVGVPWCMPLPAHRSPPPVPDVGLSLDGRYGEQPGGRDIVADADGCWTLVDEACGIGAVEYEPGGLGKAKGGGKGAMGQQQWAAERAEPRAESGRPPRGKRGEAFPSTSHDGHVLVRAAPMVHSVPCVGFVVTEAPRLGRLNDGLVTPLIKANAAALRAKGYSEPLKLKQAFKKMKPGDAFTFPDGAVLTGRDAVSPPRQGRAVVICGDTADASALAPLVGPGGCDVLVHEATNAFLPGMDKGTSFSEVRRNSARHGHSTPESAGAFAKRIGARRLVLHHFSPRYKGDAHALSVLNMLRIEDLASAAAGLPPEKVHAAWDLSTLPVPIRDELL